MFKKSSIAPILITILAIGVMGYFIFAKKGEGPVSVNQQAAGSTETRVRAAVEKVLAESTQMPKGSKLLSLNVSENNIVLNFNKDILANGRAAFEDTFQRISNAIHPIVQGGGKDPKYPELNFTVLIDGVSLDLY